MYDQPRHEELDYILFDKNDCCVCVRGVNQMHYCNRTDEEKEHISKNRGVRQDDLIVLVLQSQLKPNLIKLSSHRSIATCLVGGRSVLSLGSTNTA